MGNGMVWCRGWAGTQGKGQERTGQESRQGLGCLRKELGLNLAGRSHAGE